MRSQSPGGKQRLPKWCQQLSGKVPGVIPWVQNFCSGMDYKVHQKSLLSGWGSIIGMKYVYSSKNPEIEALEISK